MIRFLMPQFFVHHVTIHIIEPDLIDYFDVIGKDENVVVHPHLGEEQHHQKRHKERIVRLHLVRHYICQNGFYKKHFGNRKKEN